MEDVLVQLEGGVEQRPDLVLKLVDDLRFGNSQYIIEFLKPWQRIFVIILEEQLDKYLASLLVDEVFEAELVLFQSHLFRVVAVPDGGHKSLNGIRMATFFLLYNST